MIHICYFKTRPRFVVIEVAQTVDLRSGPLKACTVLVSCWSECPVLLWYQMCAQFRGVKEVTCALHLCLNSEWTVSGITGQRLTVSYHRPPPATWLLLLPEEGVGFRGVWQVTLNMTVGGTQLWPREKWGGVRAKGQTEPGVKLQTSGLFTWAEFILLSVLCYTIM